MSDVGTSGLSHDMSQDTSEDTFGGMAAVTPSGTRCVGVTIELPEPYRSELTGWRRRLGDPSAAQIPPHITLLPPTVLDVDVLAKFADHLATVAASHSTSRTPSAVTMPTGSFT